MIKKLNYFILLCLMLSFNLVAISPKELEEKALKGDAESQTLLGYYYEIGAEGLAIDYDKAIKYYEMASDQNYSEAHLFLGLIYSNLFLPQFKDYTKAKFYFEKAAANGESDAYEQIGLLYQTGDIEGVIEQDYAKAKAYFEIAANMNNAYAFSDLAYLYHMGFGVDKDLNMAAQYYSKACQAGIESSCKELIILKNND